MLGVTGEKRAEMTAVMQEATAMRSQGQAEWGKKIVSLFAADHEARSRLRAWVANLDRNYSYHFQSEGEERVTAELLLSLQG